MNEERRVFELPFRFGQVVYHKTATQKIAGLVIGFVIHANEEFVQVRFGDTMGIGDYYVYELDTEANRFHFIEGGAE